MVSCFIFLINTISSFPIYWLDLIQFLLQSAWFVLHVTDWMGGILFNVNHLMNRIYLCENGVWEQRERWNNSIFCHSPCSFVLGSLFIFVFIQSRFSFRLRSLFCDLQAQVWIILFPCSSHITSILGSINFCCVILRHD